MKLLQVVMIVLVIGIAAVIIIPRSNSDESVTPPLTQTEESESSSVKPESLTTVLAAQDGKYTGDVEIEGSLDVSEDITINGLSVLTSLPKIPGLTFNYFKSLDGSLITNVNAHHLGGKAASSFIRSDENDDVNGVLTFYASPGSTDVNGGPLYINPAASNANYTLLGLAVNGTAKLRIDASGNIISNGSRFSINGLTYAYPASQTSGVLTNDGNGNLTWVAAGVATDELTKISANDTTGGYLNGKLVAGSGVTLTENNDASNETLTIATDGAGWTESGETWTYASADDPTFTFTISGDKTGKYSPGMRVKLTQTSAKYFLITAVAYSNPNTTVTVYGGTDYDLANAAIVSPYYSGIKAPHGFPLDPSKWTVEVTFVGSAQNTPVASTWYNLGSPSISIPIGIWNTSYSATGSTTDVTSACYVYEITFSTANNTQSDSTLTDTRGMCNYAYFYSTFAKEKVLTFSSKTTYYVNSRTTSSGVDTLTTGPVVIRAVSSYL